jgi:Tfp pilus assembly protein PilV
MFYLSKKGFSVVEVMLSAALLLTAVVCFTGAIIYGQRSTQISGSVARATFLAQQGIEAVRNIKDVSYNNLVSTSCPTQTYYGLAVNNGLWTLSGTSDTTDNFLRQISICDSDSDRKLVVCTVTWAETAARNGSVILTTELTNWRNN